jgi:succinate dehydrogenase / fumarate reductase cytochrome b subunit
MSAWLDRNYFAVKRLNSLLGIFPIGLYFVLHMLLNSRANQGPEQYQWVPDTLDEIPFLLALEIGGIWLPILAHGIIGVWISTGSDYVSPRAGKTWYSNLAFYLQRFTGIALFVLITVHVWQTTWQHLSIKAAGGHFDIYGTMHSLMASPLWLTIYILFVLMAAWHFGNGIYNFAFKWGLATNTQAMRWSLALGLVVGVGCAVLGFAAIWGLTWSEWAREWTNGFSGYLNAGR